MSNILHPTTDAENNIAYVLDPDDQAPKSSPDAKENEPRQLVEIIDELVLVKKNIRKILYPQENSNHDDQNEHLQGWAEKLNTLIQEIQHFSANDIRNLLRQKSLSEAEKSAIEFISKPKKIENFKTRIQQKLNGVLYDNEDGYLKTDMELVRRLLSEKARIYDNIGNLNEFADTVASYNSKLVAVFNALIGEWNISRRAIISVVNNNVLLNEEQLDEDTSLTEAIKKYKELKTRLDSEYTAIIEQLKTLKLKKKTTASKQKLRSMKAAA